MSLSLERQKPVSSEAHGLVVTRRRALHDAASSDQNHSRRGDGGEIQRRKVSQVTRGDPAHGAREPSEEPRGKARAAAAAGRG